MQEQTQEVAKNLLSEFEKDDTLEPDSFLFKDSRFLTKSKTSQASVKEVNENSQADSLSKAYAPSKKEAETTESNHQVSRKDRKSFEDQESKDKTLRDRLPSLDQLEIKR